MKRYLSHFTVLVFVAFAFTSCRDTPESLLKDALNHMEEGTEILDDIANDKDASDNLDALEQWVAEANELITKFQELDENEEHEIEMQQLQEEYEPQLQRALHHLMRAYQQAAMSKHGTKVESIMRKLDIF